MNKRFLQLLSILIACSGTASAAGKTGLPPGWRPAQAVVVKAGPLDLKIDPALRYTLRRVEDLGLARRGMRPSPQQASSAGELPNVLDFTNERQILVPVFLKTSDPASVRSLVRELGGASSTFAGGYLSARVPPDEVADLASSPLVEIVHGVAPSSPELNLSRVEMKADAVQAGTGVPGPLTGKGVLVGIYDTGVDINHPDFKTSDGKTRIAYYWDTTRSGNPPAGFSAGWEYTAADIDGGSCEARDTDGHGTHVAGAAAGNGRFGSGTYTGIAPEADLIVVSLAGPVSSTEAVDYMFRKAAALGRPIAVNMSAGSQHGDHDGTSPDELGISALLGPGKVFVKSAGNDGARRRHVTHTIKGTDYQSSLSTGLVLDSNSSAFVRGVGALTGATFGVAVYNGSSLAASTEVKAGLKLDRAPLKSGTGDTVGYASIDASDATSSKGHVFVAIDTGASGLSWELYTYGTGQMDAWTTKGDFSAKADTGYVPGDTRTTLTIPGTARRILTVGAHITKTSWTDVDGNLQARTSWCSTGAISVGAIACFSSRGPTWDGRTKPDFTAPGMFIASALSGVLDSSAAALRKQIVSGGGYQIMQGTSMAAPHATGLVALMLQARPTLDDAGALAALKQTATRDSSTGAEPDANTWGVGKVNALDAVKAVAGAGGSTTLFVPVVLKSSGANSSFYTSEMTLTNRGSANAAITFFYTAAAGGAPEAAPRRFLLVDSSSSRTRSTT